MLPAPAFYDSSDVGAVRLERTSLVAAAAEDYRRGHAVAPAARDAIRVAALGIDAQVAFCCPGASMFVPGAVDDCRRTLAWLYRNLDRITQLFFSLDTHRVFQIFHPSWWVDESGAHPAPFTPVTAEAVRGGRFRAVRHPAESAEYVEKLEASGKYVLTIWPYHALAGGVERALEPALTEAAVFHSLVRSAEPRFEAKGAQATTESYSVLAPEVRELGGRRLGAFDAALFDALIAFDRVYVFGQAKSHCVLATLRDVRERAAALDPRLLRKFWILEDATSPMPAPARAPVPPALDFPRLADAAFAELRAAGMNVARTTDPLAP